MGMLKRIIRQTSNRLLTKLGASSSSRRLVLQSGGATSANLPTPNLICRPPAKGASGAGARARSKKAKKLKGASSAAIPEALLLAAKNYLPPVQFHHVHGPNVELSTNKLVARRTQGFCQALVFSNRVILPNERVYIKVLEIAKGWSGTIRFGFTSLDPATLRYAMPKHACPDMTNSGHTWARALADEVVRRNSIIHLSYNTDGCIHYGINNQDCGIFCANVNTSQHLWFIVDIYGLTAAVELIDPRIQSNLSRGELDFSRIDDELRRDNVSPKLDTFRLNQFYAESGSTRLAGKKKRYRRLRNQSSLSMASNGLTMSLSMPTAGATGRQAQYLPNLDSMMSPTAQQNIYTPMPALNNSRPNNNSETTSFDQHDYHQIISGTSSSHRPWLGSNAPLTSALALTDQSMSSSSASAAHALSSTFSAYPADDESQICQQFDSLTFSDLVHPILQQQQSMSKSTKSTTAPTAAAMASSTPVAAARTSRQQTGAGQKQASSSHQRDKTRIKSGTGAQAGSSKSSAGCSSNPKPRVRHSSRAGSQQPKVAARESSSSPSSKDCPICFERPINCVLYQCGHMCTCYECGVKQWKTQSRTCPICRTVIKDVIKTYLS